MPVLRGSYKYSEKKFNADVQYVNIMCMFVADMGKIASDIRIIRPDKDLKDKLIRLAKSSHRSLSKYCEWVLLTHANGQKGNDR